MTINYYYDMRYTNKAGEHRIMISINIGKQHLYLPTGVSILERYWNGKKDIRKPIKGTYADHDRLNARLYNLLSEYQSLLEQHNPQTIEEAKSIINAPKVVEKRYTFSSFFLEFVGSLNPRTAELYQNTYNKSHAYHGCNTIEFADIDFAWLDGFDKYMISIGNSINTRSMNLRNIRAVYNQAIKRDIVSYQDYPFRNFKIQSTTKEKEYLPLDVFKRLVAYKPTKKMEQTAKDIWLLSFFLCGANPIDLWNMKPAIDDVVSFQRMKIKFREPYQIRLKVTDCAKQILERYKSDDYLIDLRNFSHYDSFYTVMRHNIKFVGETIGYPQLTMYHARYTFATYTHKLGFNDSVIGHALGHSEDSTTSKFYITFDWSQVHEMQERLCLFVKGDSD